MNENSLSLKIKGHLNQVYSFLKEYINPGYLVLFLFILFNGLKNLYFHSIVVYQQFTFNNLIFHLVVIFSWAVLLAGVAVFSRSRLLFSALYLLQFIYNFVNLTYFLYFRNYLFVNVLLLLTGQVFEIAKVGVVPMYYQAFLMLLDLPLFILLIRIPFFFGRTLKQKRWLNLPVVLVPILILAGSYYWRTKHTDLAFTGDAKYVFEYDLPIAQIHKYLNSFEPGEDHISQLHTSRRVLTIDGRGKKQNILVIQVEAMESGAVLARYDGKPVMPFLYELRNKAVYYPFVLSYHLGGGTSDSEFANINSVQPLIDYPVFKVDNYDFNNSYLKVLTNSGFKTYAFHGNTGTFWDRVRTFPKMGFEEFYDMIRMHLNKVVWGSPDHVVFEKVANIIRKEKGLSLNYIITMSTHSPYNFMGSYYTNNRYTNIANIEVRNYYTAMSYFDQALQKFLSNIKDISNTTILINGDHGSLEAEGYQCSSFTENSVHYEFVPLYILTPSHDKYFDHKTAASLLDIAPTVLYLSGISAGYHTEGENLMRPDSATNKIPFKGKWYDRQELYKKIIDKTGLNP